MVESELLKKMESNLMHRLTSDPDHLKEAKDYLNSALGHTGDYALMGVQAMVKTGASKKDILEALQETPLHDLPHTLALAELARTEALVSIAQDLRYILGTIRDEGVVTK